MTVSNYSTTANSNTSVNGINISEGMSPSDVNNAQRSILTDTRSVWNDKEWFSLGDADGTTTFTRASTTTITVGSNITATHHVGRRIKIIGSNTGTIYGKISASAYSSPNTTLTFAFDSGNINSGDTTVSVYVGSVYVNPSIPVVDEDDMSSNSAILPPSQQSVKAFVESGTSILTNKRLNSPKINEDVVMSSTSTELNILDGVTATTAELNILDGVTSTTAELNILDGVTSTTAELNILDGVTSTAAELNILDGVTSSTAELNILDGVTSTTAELNYTDGVTSNIQTQLDAKLVKASNLSDVASASTSRSNLGLGTIATQASSSVSISGGSITGIGSPSSNTDVAIKSYVDQAVAGLRTRTIAECATTGNIDLSNALEAGDAIDGVTLVAGDRVLVKDQSTASENGLYIAVASGAGASSRDPEYDTIAELSGQMIVVNQGSVNDNKIFLCTTDSDGSIGSTSITYTVITPSNTGTVESVGITQSGSEFTIGNTPITSSGNITLNVNRISATKIGANTNISDTEYGYLNGVSSLIQDQLDTKATLTGTETLTNKTLTAPTITGNLTVDTNTLYVDSTNNRVGIGTTSPSHELEIHSASPTIELSDSDNDYKSQITQSGSALYFDADAGGGGSSTTRFRNNSVETMRIDSDGKVGIGTTSPSYNLDVHGGTGTIPRIRVHNTGTGANDSSILQISISGTTSENYIYFADNDDANVGQIRYDHASDFMSFTTNASEAMRIDSSGNVGIGTSNPQAELHLSSVSTPEIRLTDTTNTVEANFYANDTVGTIGSKSNHPFVFATNNTEAMRIASDGKVGIGESSPSNTLHVKNTTSSGGLIEFDGTANGEFGLKIQSNISGGNFEGDFANGGGLLDLFANSSSTSGGDILVARTQSATPVLLVKGNGKVGIGTATPSTELEVNGALLADKAYIAETALTDGATVAWNMSTQSVCKLTLGGNRTLASPANASTGQFASILAIQDGTGSRTITWNAVYEFTADTAPTLTTTANKGDLFVFRYNGSKWLEVGRNLNLTLS